MIYSLQGVRMSFVDGRTEVEALNGVTFEVCAGETLALLGQSGAGKSTLFRVLNATLRPSGGSLLFDGVETLGLSGKELRSMRRRIGTIYQQHNLVPALTALQNTLCGALGKMSLIATMRAVVRPSKAEIEQAMHALDQVGIADKYNARADELSGGQQQRLAVARVLMQSPDVILADEPTASLDPALAEATLSLLVRLALEGKKTLLMAVHNVDLAVRHFPRAIGLRAGDVAFDLPVGDVRSDMLSALYSHEGGSREEGDGEHFRYNFGCAR
ncbi:MAG: phosphonate ABC transporter ATP-binding protein [Acidobacteriaceae bacterium]